MEAVVRTIRQLQTAELPLILDMAHKFFEEANVGGEFNDEVFITAWTNFIKSNTGVIFVLTEGEDEKIIGAIGSLTYRDIITGRGTALETFWYVDKKHREHGAGAQLIRQLESWARSMNCTRLIMAALMNAEFPTMEKFYISRGYKHIEVNFGKEL